MNNNILDRFYSKLVDQPNGCTYYMGSTDSKGYGLFWIKDSPHTNIMAHVFMYTLHHKKSPDGEIHHTCENKRCCNIQHLKDMPNWEHKRLHRRKEHCIHGHKLSEVGITKNSTCKACLKISNDRRKKP